MPRADRGGEDGDGRSHGWGYLRVVARESRRRKHWGWGYEDDAWSVAQLRAIASGLEEHLRIAGDGEVREPVALGDVDAAGAARGAARRARGDLLRRRLRPRLARVGQVLLRRRARLRRPLRLPARRRRAPARRARRRGGARVGGGCERRGRALRRRDERLGRRAVRGAGALRRRRVARPRGAGPRAADRRRLARGADPGRRERAGDREAAARAGPDAALLSAVLRAVDARRLDRDARRRALRHRRDAHRRPRRVDPRDHAERRVGVAPPARLGRGRRARPDAARLGGDPRRRHRVLGARAPAPAGQLAGGRALRLVRGRRRRAARDRAVRACGPPTAVSSTPRRRA